MAIIFQGSRICFYFRCWSPWQAGSVQKDNRSSVTLPAKSLEAIEDSGIDHFIITSDIGLCLQEAYHCLLLQSPSGQW